MAGASTSNQPKPRKRVEAESDSGNTTSLVRAKDGTAFAKWNNCSEECNKDVPVGVRDFHSCGLDAIIKMKMESEVIELLNEGKKKPTASEQCNKDVAAALMDFHNCSMDAIIKMKMDAQVVELHTEAKKKPAARKKSTSTAPNAKKPKKETAKDGKKRPLTAFFIFMADFRKEYKESNPDSKLIIEVAKHAGEKWKSMSDEEKKVYRDKAAEVKAEYYKPSELNCEENENVCSGNLFASL